jgi:periplasmic divalent cation tolerance protein
LRRHPAADDFAVSWQAKLERTEEVVMLVKTRASLAEATIREVHAYEVPAISVIPLESVDRDYLERLLEETKPAQA